MVDLALQVATDKKLTICIKYWTTQWCVSLAQLVNSSAHRLTKVAEALKIDLAIFTLHQHQYAFMIDFLLNAGMSHGSDEWQEGDICWAKFKNDMCPLSPVILCLNELSSRDDTERFDASCFAGGPA